MIPENYKSTRHPSQCSTMKIQKRVFQACLLSLLKLKTNYDPNYDSKLHWPH